MEGGTICSKTITHNLFETEVACLVHAMELIILEEVVELEKGCS